MNKKLIIAWVIALSLQLGISAIAQDTRIPQEIKFEGVTYFYDSHSKENESVKKGDFDGDGIDEIIVSFEAQEKDEFYGRPFYLIYDIIGGKEKLVKTIIGNEHLGKVQIIDLKNDNQKEIVIFSHGGAHYTNIYVYKYEDGAYECIFENGSACLVKVDFGAEKPIIKMGRANWGAKVKTEDGKEIDWSYADGGHGDCLWAVYVWNGKEFIYDSKLSTASEISEEEDVQQYLDKAESLMANKEQGQFQGSWLFDGVTEEMGICTFTLDIKQDGDKIKGFYTAVALNGDKIDYDDEEKSNVKGTVKGNVAEAKFKSDWGGTGKVKITLMGDLLKWEIISGTEKGYFWCPYTVVLEREKEE